MAIYCGIDFGTTNTVVSICGEKGKFIDSFSMATIIYIPFENQGISKVFIGEEARIEFEKGKGGRFIHSIKRSLSDKSLEYTVVNKVYVTLEELIAFFLNELKKRIQYKWGINPENILLGRPVKFSEDVEEDRVANHRLLKGFALGGFKKIIQLEEPVAASICFEGLLHEGDNRFIIIDLGGGTSDFSMIRRHPEKSGIERYTIEAIDGIDIGGDNFDEQVMFSMVSPFLGINSKFKSFDNYLPMPTHIYRNLCKWNALYLYDNNHINDDFSDFLYKSNDTEGVKNLKMVIDNRYSYKILEIIRQSKHELSHSKGSNIIFSKENLNLEIF